MKNTTTLGLLIDETQQRDAIHIAIAPVVANGNLEPGQDIGFVEAGNAKLVGVSGNPIGIVDPFLPITVIKGQRFLMMLYPNTITGLRHDWTHPAFESAEMRSDCKAGSIAWMQNFAQQHIYYPNYYTEGEEPVCYTAEEIIGHATDFLKTGIRHVQQGSESLRDDTDTAEFWRHYEVITGNPLDSGDGKSPFCCTC